MRKVIATRLVQSKAPVPHFYLAIEVNMQRAKELRESANLLDPELKLSYNDIILKACAAALRQNPEVNASFQGESIRYHHRVHLGMAVATDGGGLITPVLRNADTKSLAEISRESKDLAARARTRKLLPEEYAGSTFSISNLGMMGIDEFSAVINPPEGAILAVGAVAEKARGGGRTRGSRPALPADAFLRSSRRGRRHRSEVPAKPQTDSGESRLPGVLNGQWLVVTQWLAAST